MYSAQDVWYVHKDRQRCCKNQDYYKGVLKEYDGRSTQSHH
jgi:hypothetical protein